MALLTLGTSATNSLSAIKWTPNMSQSDFAAFDALIKRQSSASPAPKPLAVPFQLDQSGHLYLPGRDSNIQLLPGDFIATDSTTGWPIVLSARAIAAGPYTHS